MATRDKVWDINKNSSHTSQKIKVSQYLKSDQEPLEVRSRVESVELERATPIINDTKNRRNIFRKLALKLRLGAKHATI